MDRQENFAPPINPPPKKPKRGRAKKRNRARTSPPHTPTPHPTVIHVTQGSNDVLSKLKTIYEQDEGAGESISDRRLQFVKQAREFQNRRGSFAQFVEFEHESPVYDVMTAGQTEWYFYWRTQLREGIFPATSLAYLTIHVYELLNQVGVRDTEHGFVQLKNLWLRYREDHPQLDQVLPEWLADYAVVHQLETKPLDVYAMPPLSSSYIRQYADMLIPNYIDGNLYALPLPILIALIDYPLEKSSIYQSADGRLLREAVSYVISVVDMHLRYAPQISQEAQKQGGVFAKYGPDYPFIIKRRPYAGAIYLGSREDITIASVYRYMAYEPLREFLTIVVKHTENAVRARLGNRQRLRVERLPRDLQEVIDQTVVSFVNRSLPARTPVNDDDIEFIDPSLMGAVNLTIPEEDNKPTAVAIPPAPIPQQSTKSVPIQSAPIPSAPIPPRDQTRRVPIPARENETLPTPVPAVEEPSKPLIQIDEDRIAQLRQETDDVFALLNLEEEGQVAGGRLQSADEEQPTVEDDVADDVQAAEAVPKVQIDEDRIAQLRQETDDVFALLNLEEEEQGAGGELQGAGGELQGAGGELQGAGGELQGAEEVSAAQEEMDSEPVEPEDELVQSILDEVDEHLVGLDEEWIEFAQGLTDAQKTVISAVMENENPTQAVDAIARQQATMPSLLLDSINELAQDTIGDLLIDTDADLEIVDEEYIEMMTQILQSS